MNEQEIEQQIQKKGLTAPRITAEHIDSCIVDARYHVFENTLLTTCCLTLRNGYTVSGHSACASPANFDAELGRQIAWQNAREQIWALEGYLLKQQLWSEQNGQGTNGVADCRGVPRIEQGLLADDRDDTQVPWAMQREIMRHKEVTK